MNIFIIINRGLDGFGLLSAEQPRPVIAKTAALFRLLDCNDNQNSEEMKVLDRADCDDETTTLMARYCSRARINRNFSTR
jgi:hypothetical protein